MLWQVRKGQAPGRTKSGIMQQPSTGNGGAGAADARRRSCAGVAVLLAALLTWMAAWPARAADPVLLRGLEVSGEGESVRIALVTSRAVSFDARVLAAPLRLEMVVPGVSAGRRLPAMAHALVRDVKVREVKGGVLFTFRLGAPALIAGAHAERAAGTRPARLVVTLRRTDAATLAAMLGVPEERLTAARASGARRPAAENAGGARRREDADAVKEAFRRLVEQAAAPTSIDDLIRAAPVTFGSGERREAAAIGERKVAGEPADVPADAPAAGGGAGPVIVVDAGHGGRDPGAVDGRGRREKDIVLKYAHALRRALEARGYRVVMTRSGDTFLKLRERSAVARRHHAALFISIHADKFRTRGIGGLGIYTLSERASDEDAAELARMENAADLIGAPDERLEDDAVRDILVELTQRETNANSHLLALRLVRALKGRVRLRRNPVRSAAFRVLRLPEIPSLLIELGYITNPRDVRDMLSAAWRKRTAKLMAQTIDRFLKTRLARN